MIKWDWNPGDHCMLYVTHVLQIPEYLGDNIEYPGAKYTVPWDNGPQPFPDFMFQVVMFSIIANTGAWAILENSYLSDDVYLTYQR